MKLFYELDFFKNPLKEDFVFPSPETSIKIDDPSFFNIWHYENNKLLDIVNPEIIKWATENKIKFESIFLILSPPNFTSLIHIDSSDPNHFPIAINWQKEPIPDSYTVWYKPKIDIVDLDYEDQDGYCLKMNNDQMEEIDRHSYILPTLVNVKIPHQAVNNSSQQKWVISLRFQNNLGPWENIVKWFQPYII